jgi:multidrug efflux pump subunit AcrB
MEREDHFEEDARSPKLTRNFLIAMGIMAAIAAIGYIAGSTFVGNLMLTVILFCFLDKFVFAKMIAWFQTRALPKFQNGYASLVRLVTGGTLWRQGAIMLGVVGLFILSGVAVGIRGPKVAFFPKGDPKFVYTYLKMPVGTRVEVTDSITKILENRIYGVIGRNNHDVESVLTNVAIGAGDPGEASAQGVSQSHLGKVGVAFKELSDRTGPATSTYMDKIREVVKGIPGAEISVDQESSGPPEGKAIAIEVAGDDYVALAKLSKKVTRYIDSLKIGGVEQLRSNLEDRNPEIAVNIDRTRANREGISTAQIGLEVRTAIYGSEASKFKTADDEYPIQVRYAEPYRSDVDAIVNAPLTFRDATGAVRQVPISSVATVTYGTTYGGIKRKDVKRVITISSNVLNGFTGPDVVANIKQALQAFPTPAGYTIKMGGAEEDQKETSDFLPLAGLGALGLIFIILVTQFNSFSKPLIILSEVIFSIAGVLFGLAITGMNISIVMTGVGIIALAGIVVKNGILLVEFTDMLRAQGMPIREAIILAGRTRLNPVILTATAAILGLIPLAIGLNIDFYELFNSGNPHFFIGGESVVFWGPLAWTIIFGLSFATIITLVVVPVMYLLSETLKAKITGKNPDVVATNEETNGSQEVRAHEPAVLV